MGIPTAFSFVASIVEDGVVRRDGVQCATNGEYQQSMCRRSQRQQCVKRGLVGDDDGVAVLDMHCLGLRSDSKHSRRDPLSP